MRTVLGMVAIGMLGAGCAKSPSGGPTPIQSPNRLAVTLRLAQPVNPGYFYSFAFDDDDDSSDGPNAIISSSPAANGIVGGSFTVLVEYRGGQFSVFRRSGDDRNETLQRVANPFIAPPSVATGQTISFTLNLDATLPDGSRLFRGTNNSIAQQLNFNFVTTTERLRDPNDSRLKAYDALGRTTSIFSTIFINTTRSITSNRTEPRDDVFLGDTTTNIVAGQLDITDFRIDVTRG